MAYVGPLGYHQLLQAMYNEFDPVPSHRSACGAYACPGAAVAFCGPSACASAGPQRRRPRSPQPSLQVTETQDRYVVHVSAPGLLRSDFNVQLKDGSLVISAQLRPTGGSYAAPIPRTFQRQLALPNDVNQDAISAKFVAGELNVVLPKVTKHRIITVPVESSARPAASLPAAVRPAPQTDAATTTATAADRAGPSNPEPMEETPTAATAAEPTTTPPAADETAADAEDFDGKIEDWVDLYGTQAGSPKADNIPEDHHILVPAPPTAPKSWSGSSPAGSGLSTPVMSQPGSPNRAANKGKAPMEPEVVAAIERQLRETAMSADEDSD
ncbi:hypothetical protein WJX72_007272 [[Myrmecia] bisecta]|uniref:SHSP domain-containing protein n=1 Tax=[Myrmecia] bisecta TaxID=41462 RepID=A0AAW1Q461_9CHLO